MKAHKLPDLSVEEYIQQEIDTQTKYEYHDGQIYALAGGTLNHGLISGNIYTEMRIQLKQHNANCFPFNSDIKLHINHSNSYVYPDTMVICGEIERAASDPNSAMNPVLIVEVLSKSTAEYDRGDKFYLYRQIPSFQEYVLIDQKRPIIDIHYKNETSDLWQIKRYKGLDQVVQFQSIGIGISMADIYFKTEMER